MKAVDLWSHTYNGLLSEVPAWVQKSIRRRLRTQKVVIVSAVCPDYERRDGKFTYQGIGRGLPYTAEKHLEVVSQLHQCLASLGIQLTYHVTLADTEFDLPLVVDHLTGGKVEEFIDCCQASCNELVTAAHDRSLPLVACGRFTAVFPDWFKHYERALVILGDEIKQDPNARYNLELNAASRFSLYQAMAGRSVDIDYCREMVLRQNAQYMAWGECAEEKFGQALIMMNHTTSNLSCVNHSQFRRGRERIPILQLSITTLPE